MVAVIRRAVRVARHAAFDLRYGPWLGGGCEESRFAHTGAHAIMHTDYDCLPYIFPEGEIEPGETLVDLGCGRGRVLNWWLSRYGETVRIIGVELDPEIAERTGRRLAHHANVTVMAGSAPEVLQRLDPTVLYMFNPFRQPYMGQVEEVARSKKARIYYWNPKVLEPWQNGAWQIEMVGAPPVRNSYLLAKISRARSPTCRFVP